jgi:hypothetical protein
MKKKTILIATFLASVSSWATTNPTTATLKIYGVAISANEDCSNATVVGYNSSGTDYDFKQTPAIFTGTMAAGTYKCVILYMSSVINFKPLANDGSKCVAGTAYNVNVCNLSNGCTYTTASPNSSNVLVYGSGLTTPVGANSTSTTGDKVLLFLSTGSTGTGDNAFKQPLAATPTYGIKLTNAFTVSDTGSQGTFVVNFDGKVDGTGSNCDLGPPAFSFR